MTEPLLHDTHRANDYSHNASSSPYKAILLNKVIVGKGRKLTQDNTSLSAPPNGYDSVRPSPTCCHASIG
jgi:hypothetical protein